VALGNPSPQLNRRRSQPRRSSLKSHPACRTAARCRGRRSMCRWASATRGPRGSGSRQSSGAGVERAARQGRRCPPLEQTTKRHLHMPVVAAGHCCNCPSFGRLDLSAPLTPAHRLGRHHGRQAVKLGEGAGVLRIKVVVDGALQANDATHSSRQGASAAAAEVWCAGST